MARNYYVYIMTNRDNSVLYIGVTSNIARRVREHKDGAYEGFSKKYNVNKLVYCEVTHDVRDAIAREKQLKRWSRAKKCVLIEAGNPFWKELEIGY